MNETLTRKRLVTSILLAGAVCVSQATSTPIQNAPDQQLFSQMARARFERDFAAPDISWLLTDAAGREITARWSAQTQGEQRTIPPGSLVKPFLALAYAEQHSNVFPKIRCLGAATHCWLPSGHGRLGLEEAIAQSCNTYFERLAEGLDRAQAARTFARYGLDGPPPNATNETLIGLGSEWRESPLQLARAYLQLEREQHSPAQSRILHGMLDSAAHGTGKALDGEVGGGEAFAKTGTAPCTHAPRGAADGFTVVLYPVAQPRYLLLVRVHGTTGSETAKIAGSMLRSLDISTK